MPEVRVERAATRRSPAMPLSAGAVFLMAAWPSLVGAQAAPPSAQTPARPASAATAQPRAAAAETLPVLEAVLMTGTSKLRPSRLGPVIAPLIGQPADAALLNKVRLAVAAAHDAAGMGLVSVDMPLMQGGVALVRVDALRLGKVDARAYPDVPMQEGAMPSEPVPAPALQPAVAAALPALRPGETPDLDAVDRQLRLANLQPHRRWAVDFRAAEDTQAAAPPARAGFSSTPGQTLSTERETPAAVAPARTLPGGHREPVL